MELFDNQDFAAEKTDYTNHKVMREFDRLRGLLRFMPEEPAQNTEPAQSAAHSTDPAQSAWYIARCAPDHYVLPLLADHFFRRFGKTSWAIIDEKRNIVFYSKDGEKPVMRRINVSGAEGQHNGAEQNGTTDDWKELWKNYHRSINNEARTNPKVQKQFMPRRYWKYLPEME